MEEEAKIRSRLPKKGSRLCLQQAAEEMKDGKREGSIEFAPVLFLDSAWMYSRERTPNSLRSLSPAGVA